MSNPPKFDRAVHAQRRKAAARMRLIYAQLPGIACKGLCHHTCVQVDMADTERDRIAQRGVRIEPIPPGRLISELEPEPCPALDEDNRCSVYSDRPLICRLWGVAEGLPCPHGCEPEAVLPDEEALLLIARSLRVGGSSRSLVPPEAEMRRRIRANPGLVAGMIADGKAGDARAAAAEPGETQP